MRGAQSGGLARSAVCSTLRSSARSSYTHDCLRLNGKASKTIFVRFGCLPGKSYTAEKLNRVLRIYRRNFDAHFLLF